MVQALMSWQMAIMLLLSSGCPNSNTNGTVASSTPCLRDGQAVLKFFDLDAVSCLHMILTLLIHSYVFVILITRVSAFCIELNDGYRFKLIFRRILVCASILSGCEFSMIENKDQIDKKTWNKYKESS